MGNLIIQYKNTDEYEALVRECHEILGEGIWIARSSLIVTYGQLGKRIIEDSLYNKYKKGSQKFLQELANDSGISYSTICRAIQFYEKYEIDSHSAKGWDKLPGGKNISWHKICNELLPEPKEKQISLPAGKYQVIYADPPWMYNESGVVQHGKEEQKTTIYSHYPQMTLEEICVLRIADLSLPNSVLFLWTTSPFLEKSFKVINSWGFEYKTSMVWDKVKHNVGNYVSVRHEFLLICTKGSCLPDNPKLHDSVITEERTVHSKKPEIFYEIIEDIYKGKKIELFSRNKRPGWSSWGNQL